MRSKNHMATNFSSHSESFMNNVTKLIFASIALLLPACGGSPARTETTTTESVVRPENGGETRQQTSETVEVSQDGSATTERTESTQTTTPANTTP